MRTGNTACNDELMEGNQRRRSHDTCSGTLWLLLTFTALHTDVDENSLKRPSEIWTKCLTCFEKKKPEGLTTTCGTVSTSASAKLLYCCGLSMTSSFFGALLALPCIINGSDKISPHKIPKTSGKPAFQTEGKSWEKKFWEVCSLRADSCYSLPSTTALSFWQKWIHAQAEETAPPIFSCAAWGKLNTHTHTMEQSDPTISTCTVTQGWQTKDTHSSSITVGSGTLYVYLCRLLK